MADSHVKGLPELQRFLDETPVKFQRNVLRGALRAAMNVVKPVAQGNIHSVSGLLAKGLKVGTRLRGGIVTSNLRATGKHAFLALWVEYGTGAHTITARVKRALALSIGAVVRHIRHPGSRPKPFMRPALDGQAMPATVAAGLYIRERLTKSGLDAAHIRVEGDE
jgi:hypothetical protein